MKQRDIELALVAMITCGLAAHAGFFVASLTFR